MKLVDYQDPRPIYEQITEGFKELILKGILSPDEKMPSVRSLAVELSANPNTVQRAYAELERQGFLYTVKGRGNFVKSDASLLEQKRSELVQEMRSLLREAEELGISREELLAEASAGASTEQAVHIDNGSSRSPDEYRNRKSGYTA